MAYFTSRYGAFWKTRKYPLNINHWYPIFYKNLLFFAYLRPKESLSANTRLFFGVYRETGAEKTKTGYKLKVVYIGTSSLKKTPLIREHSNRCHRDVSIAEFMIYIKHSVALESLSIIFIPIYFLLPQNIAAATDKNSSQSYKTSFIIIAWCHKIADTINALSTHNITAKTIWTNGLRATYST